MALREDQIHRYSRHILLAEIGGKGQQLLLGGSAVVYGSNVGAEEAAIYLVAGGVGALYLTLDVYERLAQRLKGLNPDTRINVFDPAQSALPTEAVEVRVASPPSRANGAMAALSALLKLTGANVDHQWAPIEARKHILWT